MPPTYLLPRVLRPVALVQPINNGHIVRAAQAPSRTHVKNIHGVRQHIMHYAVQHCGEQAAVEVAAAAEAAAAEADAAEAEAEAAAEAAAAATTTPPGLSRGERSEPNQ